MGLLSIVDEQELMPFKSKAQMRWMFARKPAMARKWKEHTKNVKRLPEYVDPKHSHPFSCDPSGSGCMICGAARSKHSIK